MKFLVLTILVFGASFGAETGPPPERREGGYSSTVIHHDPSHPEQQAQSSVDFTFGNEVSQEIKKLQASTKESQSKKQHTRTSGHQQTRAYKQPQSLTPTREQSQSFNVGYSVLFANGNEQKKATYTPKVEADVITGSRKEEVRKPSSARGSSRFTEPKQTHSTKIKYTTVVTPPATFIDGEKYENNVKDDASLWKSLSPSVEIYRSKDLDLSINSDAFDHAKAIGKSEGFDYSNAIDFVPQQTVESYKTLKNYKVPNAESSYNFEALNSYAKTVPDFNDNKGGQDYSFPGIKESNFRINYDIPSIKNQNFEKEYSDGLKNTKEDLIYPPETQTHASPQTLALFTPNNYHNDKTPITSKLPIDLSLLREPILTTNSQVRPDHKILPIYFDPQLMKDYVQVQAPQPTTLAQTAPQKFEENQQGDYSSYQRLNNHELVAKQVPINIQSPQQYVPQFIQRVPVIQNHQQGPPVSAHHFNNLISEQIKSASRYNQEEISDSKLIYPEYKKNIREKPKMYMVSENIQDNKQPKQSQFKVLGKPLHHMMRPEYPKYIPRYEGSLIRQSRKNPKRIIRDYNSEKGFITPPVYSSKYSRARRYHHPKY